MGNARFLLLGLLVVGCGGRTFLEGDPLDGSTDVSINPDGGPLPPPNFDGGPLPPPNFDGGPLPPPDFDGGPPPPPDFDAQPPPPPPPPIDAGPPPPPPPPPFDGGPPPPIDGGLPPPPPIDAGPPPAIKCGNTTCNAQSQQCCISQQGASCVSTGNCNGGIALSCSSSANCASGEVCCATLGGGTPSAKCASTCGNPPQAIQVCAKKSECKPNQNCIAIPQGQGLKVCF